MVSQATMNEVKKRLIETYNPREIYLFGSYAWGNPTEESDLDLLVVVDESKEKSHRRAVAGHHALYGLRIFKDLLVLTQREFEEEASDPMSLCSKIREQGKVLYARG
ncbi:MAG: nucleotidyltransferase domain-containing protein [Candidatus Dependentiae bacterium]|nr:nucleotidyltransferase domain-containing protein [Candidatus Dependentiae bacterium]